MLQTLNKSCLQKLKAQTLQRIPNKPRSHFTVKGKRLTADGIETKEYWLKGKEKRSILNFLATEDAEINRHLKAI